VIDDDWAPAQRLLRSVLATARDWADPENVAARAAMLHRISQDQFDRQVDPEGGLIPEERARRANSARSAHFALLALRSSQKRAR
jgi:uncharacterized protein (DUF2267 family)